METSPPTGSPLPLDRIALALIVWGACVACAAPELTWLDSSELAAAGVTLGVPHAPGHPLYVLLAHLASWIPFGPAAFRVALLSGFFAAWAAWFTADLVDELSGEHRHRAAGFIAGLALAASSAVWQQSVRAEVYTLHLALVLWATRDALRWWANPEREGLRAVARIAFIVGLACCNHHLLTLLHLPALIVVLVSARGASGANVRRAGKALAWGILPAVTYLVLPLRALSDPLINYGDPRTLSRFLDLVSAQVFQASVVGDTPPLGENLLVAVSMLSETIGAPMLALGSVGLVLVARRAPWIAVAVGLTVVGNIASKVSMVIDPSNPDALGYFQTSLAIIASLAGVALAWALGHAHQVVMLTGATVAGFVLLWTGTATALSFDDVDHGTARTTTVTDMALLRRVPPGALWLTSNTFLHFNRLAQQAVNGYRPDVVTIHQGFERHVQGGAPWRDTLSRRHPDLSKLAEAAVNAPLFPTSELTEESAQRAVFLEPTFALPVPVEQLHYVGGYFRLGATTRRPGQDTELQRVDEAQIRITAGPAIRDRREARTAHLILWLQLAVVRLQQGEARAAQSALEHIDALAPTNAYTSRLRPYVAELLEGETGAGDAAERIRSMDFSGLFQ